jgi:hypothetical protein
VGRGNINDCEEESSMNGIDMTRTKRYILLILYR